MKSTIYTLVLGLTLLTLAQVSTAQWVSYPGFSSGWAPTDYSTELKVSGLFPSTTISPMGGQSNGGPLEIEYGNPNYELEILFNGTDNEGAFCVPSPCASGSEITVPASAFPDTANYLVAIQLTAYPDGNILPYIQVFMDHVALGLQNYPTGGAQWSCNYLSVSCPQVDGVALYGLSNTTLGEYGIFTTPSIAGGETHLLQIMFANPCGGSSQITGCSGYVYEGTTAYLTVGQVFVWSAGAGFTSWCNVIDSNGSVSATESHYNDGVNTFGLEPAVSACASKAASHSYNLTLGTPLPANYLKGCNGGTNDACFNIIGIIE